MEQCHRARQSIELISERVIETAPEIDTMASQAALKAEYATRLMHIARQLASVAPSDRQQRIIARYVLLEADSAARWLSRWQKELAGPTPHPAQRSLKRFRREYAKQKEIRDRIVARRQAAESCRAADFKRTIELWQSLTEAGVERLCNCAQAACAALGSTTDLVVALSPMQLDCAQTALMKNRLDPDCVYTDATSYAAGERNLLTSIGTGVLGRRVMQINDVHDQLDLLFTLRDLANDTDPLGLLLRSALVVEISTLLDLTIGPPPEDSPNKRDGIPLISLVDANRGEAGVDLLSQLQTDVIPLASRINLRDLRNRIAAHLDTQLPLKDIYETLGALDVAELFRFADVTLDWLDAAACSNVDLGLLVLGHRRVRSLEPAEARARAPFETEHFANVLDSPFGAIVGGGFGARGTGGIAGIIAGRASRRRPYWLSDSAEGAAA
jgi:hypothetical protein